MISNLTLSDSIEHLKITPFVASRLHYYCIATIEDLLQLSYQVSHTNIDDPASQEIHALIDKVQKSLIGIDSNKLDRVPESSDQALVDESWPQASESAVMTNEDIPSRSCQSVTEAEPSPEESGFDETGQPMLNSLGFRSVAARKPLLLSDPVEALRPPSWVIRILKQHSVDTVEALLRLPLSALDTTSGNGVRPIEELKKKAQKAIVARNERGAESLLKSSSGNSSPEPGSET